MQLLAYEVSACCHANHYVSQAPWGHYPTHTYLSIQLLGLEASTHYYSNHYVTMAPRCHQPTHVYLSVQLLGLEASADYYSISHSPTMKQCFCLLSVHFRVVGVYPAALTPVYGSLTIYVRVSDNHKVCRKAGWKHKGLHENRLQAEGSTWGEVTIQGSTWRQVIRTKVYMRGGGGYKQNVLHEGRPQTSTRFYRG